MAGALDDIIAAAPAAAPPSALDDLIAAAPAAKTTGPAFNAAEPPSILDRLKEVFTGSNTAYGTAEAQRQGAQTDRVQKESILSKPLLDLSALGAEDLVPGKGAASQVARGAVKGAESFGSGLTTPTNAEILAGTAGLGEAAPIVSKLLSAGFSAQMLKNAFEQSPQFGVQVHQGDYEGAARTLTEVGLGAAAGVAAAKHAASPEGIAPEGTATPEPVIRDQALADRAPSPDATSLRPNDEALQQILKVAPPGPKRDALTEDAKARGIEAPAIETRQQQVTDTLAPVAEQDDHYNDLFDQADQKMRDRQQNPPSPRKAAPPASVPEEGIPEQVTRVQYARENLARQMEGKSFGELPNSSRLAIDDLIRQGYGQVGEPPELSEKNGQPENGDASDSSPSNDVEKPEVAPANLAENVPAKPAREPQKPVAYGNDTQVAIPGENRSYAGVYALREASDVYPSHNPFSFEPNPDYHHTNDRNYAEPRNAERIVKQESEFDPGFLINDNPDATNGPPIIDQAGNVLGGNSRAMTLARVRENRPESSDAYKQLLAEKSKRFGIAPELVAKMDKPVLVRQLTDDVQPQRAITDLNKTGTAALTQAERAISDSKRISPETADYLTGRIDEQGQDGTLAQALEGSGGKEIINRLVDDGVITQQEKPTLLNSDGSLTPDGKKRIASSLSGRFFASARELEETPPELRAKLDRVVAPVMRTAGRPEWDLTEPTKEAVSLMKEAKARGVPVDDIVRQQGLFGTGGYSDDGIAIARKLEDKPTAVAKAFRQYASDEALSRPGSSMTMGFEPPARGDAFEAAFGKNPDRGSNSEQSVKNSAPMSLDRVGVIAPKGGAPSPSAFGRILDATRQWIRRVRGDETAGEAKLSSAGALKSKFVRNLSQLEEASPKAWEAAVQTASSKSQAAVMMRGAVPKIITDLKGSGVNWDTFRSMLVESRLRGARQRWHDLADAAAGASDKQLEADFPNYASLLENVEGRRGIAEDARQKAEALLDRRQFEQLRAYIVDRLSEAGDRVGTVMPPRTSFEMLERQPGFRRALAKYKQSVERPLAQSHAANEGIFSDALGPLDTYYPLVPLTEDRPSFQTGKSTPYRKPKNIANAFATGLGEQYDLGAKALLDRVSTALRMNNRAGLIQALLDEGLARKIGKFERSSETINIGGRDFTAHTVETGTDRQVFRNGKMSYVPADRALIPDWLASELDPILEKKKLSSPGLVRRVLDRVNQFALAGPTDAVFHSTNILGSIVANTPYLGQGFTENTIGNTPITKLFTAAVKISGTDATAPEAMNDLAEMARKGMLGDRYARETYSKLLAEQSGATLKRFTLGPLLNGPNGLDVRARLVLYRLAKQINPEASTIEQTKFVNQLGNYVHDLQGTVERRAKLSGFAPFYTAGSTMLRNGINAWTGQGPMPKSDVGLRVAQQLSGGAAGVVSMWALTYRAATGKWPWEDDRAKFLEIPVPDSVRQSDFGRHMWGSDFSKDGYVRFAYFDPIVERGARALGVEGATNALLRGGTGGQAVEHGLQDTMNSAIEPTATGPGTKAGFILATGREPAISSLRDRFTGEFGPEFYPATETASAGLPALASRGFEAALNTNSFFQNAAAAAGIAHKSGQQPETKADAALRMVMDLAFPRLLSAAYNADQHATAIDRERQAIERAVGNRR